MTSGSIKAYDDGINSTVSKTFKIWDGTITRENGDGINLSDGDVSIDSAASLYLYGGTVTGFENGLALGKDSSYTHTESAWIYGGYIHSVGKEPGVYCSGLGSLNLSDTGSIVSDNSQGIRIYDDFVLNMYGGDVTGYDNGINSTGNKEIGIRAGNVTGKTSSGIYSSTANVTLGMYLMNDPFVPLISGKYGVYCVKGKLYISNGCVQGTSKSYYLGAGSSGFSYTSTKKLVNDTYNGYYRCYVE